MNKVRVMICANILRERPCAPRATIVKCGALGGGQDAFPEAEFVNRTVHKSTSASILPCSNLKLRSGVRYNQCPP